MLQLQHYFSSIQYNQYNDLFGFYCAWAECCLMAWRVVNSWGVFLAQMGLFCEKYVIISNFIRIFATSIESFSWLCYTKAVDGSAKPHHSGHKNGAEVVHT